MTRQPRVPAHVIHKLRQIRDDAACKHASFANPYATLTARGEVRAIDTFIKEETRHYRKTWLVHPLDELIAWAEGADMPPEWERP